MLRSRPARGVGVEIVCPGLLSLVPDVTSREGHGSRIALIKRRINRNSGHAARAKSAYIIRIEIHLLAELCNKYVSRKFGRTETVERVGLLKDVRVDLHGVIFSAGNVLLSY